MEVQHANGRVCRDLDLHLPVEVRSIGFHHLVQAAAADELCDNAELGRRGARAHEQDAVHMSDLDEG